MCQELNRSHTLTNTLVHFHDPFLPLHPPLGWYPLGVILTVPKLANLSRWCFCILWGVCIIWDLETHGEQEQSCIWPTRNISSNESADDSKFCSKWTSATVPADAFPHPFSGILSPCHLVPPHFALPPLEDHCALHSYLPLDWKTVMGRWCLTNPYVSWSKKS